jgi:hypothetical protein
LPSSLMQQYAPTSVDLSGAVLTRPVRAGELIHLEWVAAGPAARAGRSMTIPLPPEQGLATDLSVGDRLDVLVTLDAGDVRARTLVLASDVQVLEVVRAPGLVSDADSVVGVTVAVTPAQEVELAFGIRTGEIDIARVEGSAPAPVNRTVTGEDLP